jgi:hypothetical protein
MRRDPFPRRRSAAACVDLPLSHVPEGDRRPLRALRELSSGRADLDPGPAQDLRSSEAIARGFCGDCGTPLTFEAASGEGDHIALTIGAFDQPSRLQPQRQIMTSGRIVWVDHLADVPARSPEEDAASAARYPPVVSHQHPDHDTEVWPPDQ